MNIKCFFCNSPLEMELDTSGGPFRVRHSLSCKLCEKQGNLHEVISTYKEDGSFQYAHIHTDEPNYKLIDQPRMIGRHILPPIRVRTNISYHIRYNVDENTTDIIELGDIDPIVSVPGQKINPANAREKLKLYLLFS